MLRPLGSAMGGPLTKALNKAYASRLQSVQDREKSSGPDAGLASASSLPSSPYEPAEIDSALLSPRHRMQGRRALRPIRPPVAAPAHAHWRCGSAGLDQPVGQALHRRGDGRAAAKIVWTSSRSAPASTRADARRAEWRSVRLVAEPGAESCRAYPRKPKLGPGDCTHAHAALKPQRKRTTCPMLVSMS